MSSCSLSSSPFSFRKEANPSRLSAVSAKASGAAPSSSEACPPFTSIIVITSSTSCSASSDAGLRIGMSLIDVMKLRMKSSTVLIILSLLRLTSVRLGGSAKSTACLRNLVNSAELVAYSSSLETIERYAVGREAAGVAGGGTGRFAGVGFGVAAGAVGRAGRGAGFRGAFASAIGVSAVSVLSVASCARVKRGRWPESARNRPHRTSTVGRSIFFSVGMLTMPLSCRCSKSDSSSSSSSCLRNASGGFASERGRAGGLGARARSATPKMRWMVVAAVSLWAAISDCSRRARTRASLRFAAFVRVKGASSAPSGAVSPSGSPASASAASGAGLSGTRMRTGRAFCSRKMFRSMQPAERLPRVGARATHASA